MEVGKFYFYITISYAFTSVCKEMNPFNMPVSLLISYYTEYFFFHCNFLFLAIFENTEKI